MSSMHSSCLSNLSQGVHQGLAATRILQVYDLFKTQQDEGAKQTDGAHNEQSD